MRFMIIKTTKNFNKISSFILNFLISFLTFHFLLYFNILIFIFNDCFNVYMFHKSACKILN